MGADNWDPCPRCVDQANAEYEKAVRLHAENYGILSSEEWLAERKSLTVPEEAEHTFREDYEWWVDDAEATLHGVFKGCCTQCGLTVRHEVEPIKFYTREDES